VPSNNSKITRHDREAILATYIQGKCDLATLHATRLGLRPDYPRRLARERGLLPRADEERV
jgi:hypothetical protein